MNQIIKLPTDDGSYTLLRSDIGEAYHSLRGAITESLHVFICQGLEVAASQKNQNNSIKILEVGLGTGLNCLLSALRAPCDIQYTGIDNLPPDTNMLRELDYPQQLKHANADSIYHQIISSPWNVENATCITGTNASFMLSKQHCALLDFSVPEKFDLVYYDAFAPKYQPDMWTEQSIACVSRHIRPNGILVTYCAQGNFRRILQTLGWRVERVPGPLGFKKEMIRAHAP